jgi:transposase-like protein
MPRYRSFDVAFKRQVAQEFLTGESLNSLSRKYDIARNLIRIWVLKHEGGEFEPEFEHDTRRSPTSFTRFRTSSTRSTTNAGSTPHSAIGALSSSRINTPARLSIQHPNPCSPPGVQSRIPCSAEIIPCSVE